MPEEKTGCSDVLLEVSSERYGDHTCVDRSRSSGASETARASIMSGAKSFADPIVPAGSAGPTGPAGSGGLSEESRGADSDSINAAVADVVHALKAQGVCGSVLLERTRQLLRTKHTENAHSSDLLRLRRR